MFQAATEDGEQIRYPTGPDTRLLADLRWTTSEHHYLQKMREMFRPKVPSRVLADTRAI